MYIRISIITIITTLVIGQIEPSEGLRENPPRVWAFINGSVYVEPDQLLGNSTIIIRDGLIENVGADLTIPSDATILDMSGMTIYPGFIDSWVEIPAKSKDIPRHDDHWNFKVNSHRELSQIYEPSESKLRNLHKLGFTVAHIVPDSGIFKGQTALVQLNQNGIVLNSAVSQDISYEIDGWGSDKYPNSLLGGVALMRQTFIDAKWYGKAIEKINQFPTINEPIRINKDLKILNNWMSNNFPFVFETNHELTVLRSFKIAREFQLNIWIFGSGYEYRRISEIAAENPFIILPLNFPINPDISDPNQELRYSTSELKHWDMAPDNPTILNTIGISFAITSHGLEGKEFRKNIALSVERGFPEHDALAALTTIPAKKMGKASQLGKIQPGFLANLTITDGSYFNPKSQILAVWISGVEYTVKPKYYTSVDGKWSLNIGNKKYELELKKRFNHYSGKILQDTTDYKLSKLIIDGRFINWQVQLDSNTTPSRFIGHILGNRMEGTANDLQVSWSALKIGTLENEEDKKKKNQASNLTVFYPEGTYGLEDPDFKSQIILIKNTTLWTCGKQGKLEEIDILFKDGKVKKIGTGIKPSKGCITIDGFGKHVTPGLIDCHSHSAAFSINEGTQSITAEVRIQDVINSDDITIYRELAGGLTMANILHGSANAIGGQNAVIKLRWGATPEGLLYKNAMPGIKFALGENVKQSNWGDDYSTRYPQTRMGVEQIIRDAFTSALEYQVEWNEYNNNKNKWKKEVPPRRDLELDALVEILEGKRQIHCHSYRQDEILMLTRVAEDFGFTIGTFQHVLEGYKVAERLKEHGANASTFSDWWAYKYEVIDAIPYNGALMTDVGVNVSFNSDSGELARRMNTEAAKGVKYGGLSEEEALKLVTLNPAIQLGIDKWVGSLEVGKDADFVIWNDHPLSTRAVCEQTWIDGKQYFSLEKDAVLKIRDNEVRNQLVNKILSNKEDKKEQKWNHYEEKSVHHQHCLEQP